MTFAAALKLEINLLWLHKSYLNWIDVLK